MNLRSLANSFVAADGQVTFHMLPFMSLETEVYRDELGRVSPQHVYVHKQTGEERNTPPVSDPKQWKKHWEERNLWGFGQDTFQMCVPITVSIEFNLNDTSPMELKALEVFWNERTQQVAQDWKLFCQLISADVITLWWQAFTATRDKSMSANAPVIAAVGDDPKDVSGGDNTEAA